MRRRLVQVCGQDQLFENKLYREIPGANFLARGKLLPLHFTRFEFLFLHLFSYLAVHGPYLLGVCGLPWKTKGIAAYSQSCNEDAN
jgi:hypothetical protein